MSGIGIALAAVGAAVAIGTAAASGAEAGKSKKAAKQAERVAQKKMEEARLEIQRMPLQELSLDLQGYRENQEASQVSAAMAIDAGQQGEARGLSAMVGRAHMADISQQRNARLDRASDMEKLELLKANERRAASDKLLGLSLAEVEGAQQAAADSEEAAAAYTSQAIQSGMQAVQGVANVAGAAVAPKMEAGAAFDKNLASIPEADLKSYLTSNKASLDAIGGVDVINNLDASGIRDAYIKYFSKDVSKWSDPDYLSQIYTPASNLN
jgi:hypothetical protein